MINNIIIEIFYIIIFYNIEINILLNYIWLKNMFFLYINEYIIQVYKIINIYK